MTKYLDIYSDLIKLAAQMAKGEGVPDWSERVFSTGTPSYERRDMLSALRMADEAGITHALQLRAIADRLSAEMRSSNEPSEQRSEETGWLIELAIKGIPHWLMVSSDREWTTDSNEALRFAREQDAEAMLYHSGLEGAKATGHTWCDPLPNKGAQEIGLCPHGMPRAMSECLPCVGANALEAARRATIPITPDELCPRCGRYMRVQLMGRSVCPICPGG